MSENLRYGESEIRNFDVQKDLEIWENKHERDYTIKITLPEFCCLCPRSGYPDFATIYLEYVPNKWVVELKAIKLYINSFMNRHISHEDSINEIYTALFEKLQPKFMKIKGDFNPRGNVHTVIEICSENLTMVSQDKAPTQNFKRDEDFKERENFKKSDRFGSKNGGSRGARDAKGSKFSDFKDEKPRRSSGGKDGFKKLNFSGDKKPRVVKKDKR